MSDPTYDGVTTETPAAAGSLPQQRINRRRRPPSPAEQARRVAWGKKWGRLVSELTRQPRN